MEDVLLPPSTASDDRLFRELMDRFTVLAETCARFSQDVYRRTSTSVHPDPRSVVERNLRIARSVFAKESLETLATIYLYDSVGLDQLRTVLGPVSFPFLRRKLRELERTGFVQRTDASKGSKDARYSLTHKGKMIARLGEPVFLYLRLAEGWRNSAPRTAAHSDADPASPSGTG